MQLINPMNLIAIVNQTEEIIETMWGDPNRWDDWQRRIYKIFLTVSDHDLRGGYSLERLDMYESAQNPGASSIQKSGVNPFGITRDSLILIVGPLYRADTCAFREYELTEGEKPVYAVPFKGYSGPKTIEIEYYDGAVKVDRRRRLRPLSIKTAAHAIGYLPEEPVSPLDRNTNDPYGIMILNTLESSGNEAVRKKYFSDRVSPGAEPVA